MKIVRCLLDQVIFISCLNYCSVSNNIVVRAAGSIAWPLRSRLGQLTLLWWITKLGLHEVPNLPFLQGDLIKETLQLDSFYQNVRLFKCQQLSINCETRYSWEDWWQWLPPLFLVSWHSLLNGVMVIGEWEPGVLPATNTVKNGVCTLVDMTCLEVQSWTW